MSANVFGRRRQGRGARSSKKPSPTVNSISSLPVQVSAVKATAAKASSALGVGQKIIKTTLPDSSVESKLKLQDVAPPKPNVFQFLQQGDSTTSSNNTSEDEEEKEEEEDEHEDVQNPTAAQSHRMAVGTHSSYPMSPESSYRASSPEQTFSVTSRDSALTGMGSVTSQDGSPAANYLRFANRQHLQKTAQARNQRAIVRQREIASSTDGEGDDDVDEEDKEANEEESLNFSNPEDFYHSHHRRYRQHRQKQRYRSRPHSRRHRSSRTYSDDLRTPSKSPERSAGTLVTTETSNKKSSKIVKTSSIEHNSMSGYALLASKLDSSISKQSVSPSRGDHGLVPVYRKFEHINHRILLHLQDEISQMEEELQMMDEYEAKHRAAIAEKDGSGKIEPGSRRMDVEAARYSAFHSRRLELIDRLTYRTNQYNDTLAKFAKLNQILPKASSKDVETYKTWMGENTPIARNETQFLDHDHDLVSLFTSSPASATTVRGEDDNSRSILYFIIGVLLTALLLPLLAF